MKYFFNLRAAGIEAAPHSNDYFQDHDPSGRQHGWGV